MSIKEMESRRTGFSCTEDTLSTLDRPRIQRGETRLRVTGIVSGRGEYPSSARGYTARIVSGVQALIEHRKQHRVGMIDIADDDPVDLVGTMSRLLQSVGTHGDIHARKIVANWESLSRLHDFESDLEEGVGTGGSDDLRSPSFSGWVECVDWELKIESPPSRPSRTVMVKFEKVSYRRPRIIDNPEE